MANKKRHTHDEIHISPTLVAKEIKKDKNFFVIDIANIHKEEYNKVYNAFVNLVWHESYGKNNYKLIYTGSNNYFSEFNDVNEFPEDTKCYGTFFIYNFKKEYRTFEHKLRQFRIIKNGKVYFRCNDVNDILGICNERARFIENIYKSKN